MKNRAAGNIAMILAVIPLLLAFHWRIRFESFSFVLAEISLPLALVCAMLCGKSESVSPSRKVFLLAVVLAVAAFLSVFVQSDLKHTLSAYRDLLLPVLFYFAFTQIRLKSSFVVNLAKAAVLWSSVTAVLGIIQYLTDDFLWFQDPDAVVWQEFKTSLISDSQFGQFMGISHTLPAGAYSHTNVFAQFLVLPALVAFALFLRSARNGISRWLWLFAAILQFVALVLTFCRSSVLTLVGSMLVLPVLLTRQRSRRKLGAALVLAVGAVAGFAILQSDAMAFDGFGSFVGRIDMWQAGFVLMSARPVLAITGGLTELYLQLFPFGQVIHNFFLYLTIQFGLAAAGAWALIVFLELKRTARILHRDEGEARNIGVAAAVAVGATVFFYAQTAPLVDDVQVSLFLFFWLGISQHLVVSQDEVQVQEAPNRSLAGMQAERLTC